ncbi:hypothetical protein MHK_010791 [Candidatus Magnetomorum sp. HK-1]|nr:hypothetical protein MHK_010791 [Candidatus Magnetomorum sp. HK-1]
MSRNKVRPNYQRSDAQFGKWPAFDVTEPKVEASPMATQISLENGRLLMSRNLVLESIRGQNSVWKMAGF